MEPNFIDVKLKSIIYTDTETEATTYSMRLLLSSAYFCDAAASEVWTVETDALLQVAFEHNQTHSSSPNSMHLTLTTCSFREVVIKNQPIVNTKRRTACFCRETQF